MELWKSPEWFSHALHGWVKLEVICEVYICFTTLGKIQSIAYTTYTFYSNIALLVWYPLVEIQDSHDYERSSHVVYFERFISLFTTYWIKSNATRIWMAYRRYFRFLSLFLSSACIFLSFSVQLYDCTFDIHEPLFSAFFCVWLISQHVYASRLFTECRNRRNWTCCREIKLFRCLSAIEFKYGIDFSLHRQIMYVRISTVYARCKL